MTTTTFTFTRTHTSAFVADNMRNQLRTLIQAAGLDPTQLVDDWDVLGQAVQTWLASGHLTGVTIEFYKPGSNRAERRWDFDITYDGSGVDDDMWVDRDHVRRTIEKVGRPPAGCVYRVILASLPGRAHIYGMGDAQYKSTEGLIGRSTGTAIATQDIMAGLKYWKAA